MKLIFSLIFAAVGLTAALFLLKSDAPPGSKELESVEVKIDRSGHIKEFIGQYCADCHDEDVQKGGINLTSLDVDVSGSVDEIIWSKAFDQISSGKMPPQKKKKQPTDADRSKMVGILAEQLTEKIEEKHKAIGRTVIRRLTREEYENTLRDLLSLPDLEVKGFLPPDQKSEGFDNVAHDQTLSHVQIGRYLEAADFALDNAINPEPRPVYRTLDKKATEIHRFSFSDDKKTIGDKVYLVRQPNTAQTPWYISDYDAHYTGRYRIKIWAYGSVLKNDKEELCDQQHVLMFYANPSSKVLRKKGNADIPSNKCAKPVEIEIDLHAGERPQFQIATIGERKYGPAVALERIVMEGPLLKSWPPAGHQLLFGDLKSVEWKKEMKIREPLKRHSNYKHVRDTKKVSERWMVVSENAELDARRLLLSFMNKAYRRPVEESEIGPFLALISSRLKENYTFQDAMKTGYKAVLCSPDFIYLKENYEELNSYALASRLSYFLWKSMPDSQLLELAENGKIKEESVLKGEVERMLQDSKAKRFIHSFVNQWLELEDINLTFPDSKLYPEFDDWLLDSMARETYAFVTQMVNENLSTGCVVDSDFLMLNQRLADLYGIEGVTGDEIRPVKIDRKHERGGLITQASILKITANGTTTSPVIRGAWVTENIMGKYIPPPPPNAGSVEPDTRGATTIRELLDKHRNNESCAGCHKVIDPAGFALESFDPMGGFRTKYRNMHEGDPVKKKFMGEDVRYKMNLDVDSAGQTKDGKPFKDIDDLRAILLQDKKGLAENAAKKLMIFATGSRIHFNDRKVIEQIVNNTSTSDYGLKSIIHEIVQSKIFRSK